MVNNLVNVPKSKWLSSRLNIATNSFSPELPPEEGNENFEIEKHKWISSRLKIFSKPAIPENPLQNNATCISTEEQYLVKDLQVPLSTKLCISKSQVVTKFLTDLVDNENAENISGDNQKQKATPIMTKDDVEVELQCDLCPFVATKENSFKIHVTKFHKLHPKCNLCDQPLSQYHRHCKLCTFVVEQKGGKLLEHVKTAHTNNAPLQCLLCEKILKTKTGMRSHRNMHLGVKYDCNKCPLSFRRKVLLDEHNFHDRHKNICKRCGKSFPPTKGLNHTNNLSLHMKMEHKAKPKGLKCNLCSAILCTKPALRDHLKKHNKNCQVYSCSQCSYKILVSKKFARHCLKFHNVKIERNFLKKCSLCGLQVRKNVYVEHKSTHLEECQRCDFSGFSLANHMRIHEEGRCTICGKEFTNLTKLTYHQTSVHGIFDVSIFVHKCDLCNMGSRTMKALNRHKILYHYRNMLQCEKCKFEALTAKKMKTHRLTHEEKIIKYLTCSLCDFRSPFEKALSIHRLRVHDGYCCNKCESRFTSSYALKQHKLIHTELECKECNFVAPAKRDIIVHYKDIHKGMKCLKCENRFPVLSQFYRHQLKHKELECKMCDHIARLETDYVKHMIMVHNQCNCNNKKSTKHLDYHVLRKCVNCDFKGFNKQLKAHEKGHQIPNRSQENRNVLDKIKTLRNILITQPLGRKDNPKTYSRKTEIEVISAETESLEFGCDICEFKTVQPNLLLQHVKVHTKNYETENANIDK